MKEFVLALLLASMVYSAAIGADEAAIGKKGEAISGSYLVLSTTNPQPNDPPRPTAVTVGGLIVVVIPDTMSKPTEKFAVNFGREFKHLGTFIGAQTLEGDLLFGGGKTLYLLQPINESQSEVINLTYTENGSGDVKTFDFKIKIEKFE